MKSSATAAAKVKKEPAQILSGEERRSKAGLGIGLRSGRSRKERGR